MLSTLMTVMAVAPLLGPVVGGQLLALAGWRAIFWTLVGVGLLTLAALFTLPETLPRERRNTEPLARAFARYGERVRHRALLGYAGAIGCFYAGTFAYVAGTPFAYISYHQVSPQLYGVLFALGIVGIMATNLVNARLVARAGSDRLLRAGAAVAALAGAATAVAAWTGWGGLPGLVAPLFVFVSATGFIVANAIVGALAISPQRAGAVSALVGAVQYGAGMIGSALVGAFADATPWPMGWVIALAGLGSAACAWLLLPAPVAARAGRGRAAGVAPFSSRCAHVRVGAVLRVGHLLHPVDALAVQRLRNGNVGHRAMRHSAVPMLLAGGEPDDVAGADFFHRATLALGAAQPSDDEQRLAQWMRVPRGARARFEGDGRAADARVAAALEPRVDPDRAGEIRLRPPGRGLRAAALDVHDPSPSFVADRLGAAWTWD